MNDVSLASSSLFNFSVFGWPYTGLVTLLTLLLYQIFAMRVGRLRRKLNITPPVTDGPPEFVRAFRIHLNTAEQLLIFLPLLWITALSTNDVVAAAIGVFWPLSRLVYSRSYMADPKGRLPGFIMGVLILIVLFLASAVQLVRSALVWQ